MLRVFSILFGNCSVPNTRLNISEFFLAAKIRLGRRSIEELHRLTIQRDNLEHIATIKRVEIERSLHTTIRDAVRAAVRDAVRLADPDWEV